MPNHPVLTAMLPVVMLIATGLFTGKRQWVSANSAKDFTVMVFYVLCPALLFRTMSKVHLEHLDMKPVWVYFLTVFIVFSLLLFLHGFNRRGTVLALGGVFSNTVMIGIPLIDLAYGKEALTHLFTLISLHSLVLLTTITIVLEFTVLREQRHHASANHLSPAVKFKQIGQSTLLAIQNSIIHPVPLPILFGLFFGLMGWQMPEFIDRPLALLGQAFGPMALVLVGITLAHASIGSSLTAAMKIASAKLVLMPICVAFMGKLFGIQGLPFTVMVVAASMPIGANVFLFSHRYRVAENEITAGVAVSTAMALVTVTLIMAMLNLVA